MWLLYSKTFRLSLISFRLKRLLNTALLHARLLAIAHVWCRPSMCWASTDCLRNSNLTIYGIFPVFLPLSNTLCLVFTTTAWLARAFVASSVAARLLSTNTWRELYRAMEHYEAPTAPRTYYKHLHQQLCACTFITLKAVVDWLTETGNIDFFPTHVDVVHHRTAW